MRAWPIISARTRIVSVSNSQLSVVVGAYAKRSNDWGLPYESSGSVFNFIIQLYYSTLTGTARCAIWSITSSRAWRRRASKAGPTATTPRRMPRLMRSISGARRPPLRRSRTTSRVLRSLVQGCNCGLFAYNLQFRNHACLRFTPHFLVSHDGSSGNAPVCVGL